MQLLPYLHLPQVPLPGCHGQVPELRKLMTNKNILFQIFSRKKPVHQPPSFLSSKLCRKLTRLSITNKCTLSRLPVASGVPTASPPSSLLAKSVAYGFVQQPFGVKNVVLLDHFIWFFPLMSLFNLVRRCLHSCECLLTNQDPTC